MEQLCIMEYPHYCQADIRWSQRILGRNKTIKQAGCAVTALSMAISGDSEINFTPAQLDESLDNIKGYSGDSVIWDKVLQVGKSLGAKWIKWNHCPTNTPQITDETKTVIVRVKTLTGSYHYLLSLPDGKFHDPGSKWGSDQHFDKKRYTIDRYTIFYKE